MGSLNQDYRSSPSAPRLISPESIPANSPLWSSLGNISRCKGVCASTVLGQGAAYGNCWSISTPLWNRNGGVWSRILSATSVQCPCSLRPCSNRSAHSASWRRDDAGFHACGYPGQYQRTAPFPFLRPTGQLVHDLPIQVSSNLNGVNRTERRLHRMANLKTHQTPFLDL